MYESREPVDPDAVRRFLDSCTGEREVAKYLRQYPDLLYWTFCRTGGHSRYVFCEFPLGSRYKVDVVALIAYSGAWRAHFIELEPIDDPVFSKDGTPSKRLATAVRQIDDWREYMDTHKAEVRDTMVQWARDRDLLGYSDRDPPCNYTQNYLHDLRTVMWQQFHVVIGRSSAFSEETRERVGRFPKGHSAEITSYDRFVRVVAERHGEAGTTGY